MYKPRPGFTNQGSVALRRLVRLCVQSDTHSVISTGLTRFYEMQAIVESWAAEQYPSECCQKC